MSTLTPDEGEKRLKKNFTGLEIRLRTPQIKTRFNDIFTIIIKINNYDDDENDPYTHDALGYGL